MNIYKWYGSGHYLGATVICVADCMKSAEEIIETELINSGLSKSWDNQKEIEEIIPNTCKLVYFDNGDY